MEAKPEIVLATRHILISTKPLAEGILRWIFSVCGVKILENYPWESLILVDL